MAGDAMTSHDQVMRKVSALMDQMQTLFLPGTHVSLIVRSSTGERPALVHTTEPDIGALGRVLLAVGTPQGETKQ